ncbi:MAG: CRISPR-associated endonuclease Cas2 [bacterium]
MPIWDSNKKDILTFEKRNCFRYQYFNFTFSKISPKNLIIIYDIPEEKRKERDWFRRHLKKFNYIMIQKSVWVGPSPLPKDFFDYVKSIGLLNKLKTFKLAEPYKEGKNRLIA